ncbi:protein NEOXANTHIN-DEFICIENT 1 isoform X3 [Selaginella moellendorffii]|uniref:protein NEOXANTHIN-DEFICIENT 1 isoform X3 n=1 Tax=Selaginella moellendorffii TaxID=88036 RepID=UPI000D1C7D0D|nr:protein NEOXANTHIN-DEFICIENT 1 isoform X3 [Selaginella moellendorffii]|eukprot:XP_024539206.1 protein NEOXANTHIN-DEFICIENT 1 isoform X3 [Selaginella moellendorffii]
MALRRKVKEFWCVSFFHGFVCVCVRRALYQMHLVKAETARRHIPGELKLVEAFGYTLGGFFLAHYNDSPVGPFDELVVIAGIVWNPPTSCAWAARVLVNDKGACRHGRMEVGLPSQLASFSHPVISVRNKGGTHQNRFNFFNSDIKEEETHGLDVSRGSFNPWCRISMAHSLMNEATRKGPPLNFCLPSFSGNTRQQPNILKYSCDLSCRVAASKPASISAPEHIPGSDHLDADILEILSSKPVLALSFEDMQMAVRAPTVLISKQAAAVNEKGAG